MTEKNGIIVINKPEGWTSQDVCAKLRNRLHIKKIGHTGTLDPMAAGVLPVCIGKATRIIEYYDKDIKSYHAAMKLGLTSDTLDITGELTETGSYREISEKSVRDAFKAYTGVISQVPPKYSALKINGRRAYELAREGKDFEIRSREITIYENSPGRIDLENGEIEFDVSCSKGTYIRTICDDIGKALGCGAVMTALTRTASGCFRIEESHTIEEVSEAADDPDALAKLLIPADITLENLGSIRISDKRVSAFINGNSSWLTSCRMIKESRFGSIYRVYASQGAAADAGIPAASSADTAFLGIAEIEGKALVPRKVFR